MLLKSRPLDGMDRDPPGDLLDDTGSNDGAFV